MAADFTRAKFDFDNIRGLISPGQIIFFKELEKPAAGEESAASAEEDDEQEREIVIVCRFCRNIVAKKKDMMEINGRHYHVFKNPAGIIFHIGCYVSARGCMNMGIHTGEYSWFPGFLWRYAICSVCHAHLGWHYTSGNAGFYGLILDNIEENEI